MNPPARVRATPQAAGELCVAVAGNPNAGKTTLFNRLTGLRQKVGNYPGVTVERKEGSAVFAGRRARVIDLPGAYSLTAHSPDEAVARDIVFGWQPDCPPPDVLIVVVDASHLERNLFLATQLTDLGWPTVLALNMVDVAEDRGVVIDVGRLEELLGVRVVPLVASTGRGLPELEEAVRAARPATRHTPLRPVAQAQVDALADRLASIDGVPGTLAMGIATRVLVAPQGLDDARRHYGDELADAVSVARAALAAEGCAWQGCEASARYAWLRQVAAQALLHQPPSHHLTRSDRVDRVLTHRWCGPLIFALVMAVVFQSIYTWATPFMDAIDHGAEALKHLAHARLPAGPLTDLLADGVITGVGAVLVFLPQILVLFFFLALLEESGYMARAAFVMDRLMSKVGLHGRSFVPLLSAFACAIPGIMAARTIASRRDRLVTILVAPLMTCSARLPVYALLIGAFVPARPVLGGVLSSRGVVLLGLYALGVVSALGMAFIFKRTLLRGPTPALVLELPPYRVPNWGNVLHELLHRAWLFVRFAGTLILTMSIVLWFLAAFPRYQPAAGAAPAAGAVSGEQQLEHSYLGRLGRVIEPVVRPLGFDWRIGVGLVSAFAAREMMVSTLGVIFAVSEGADESDQTLMERLGTARRADGRRLFSAATVAALLVFFVYALQCVSTIGVVVRETGGWRWARFMLLYLSLLAYTLSFLTYRGLCVAGLG
jgi:ferrous iron transport protein B